MFRRALGAFFLSTVVACAVAAEENGAGSSELSSAEREAKVGAKLDAIRADAQALDAFLTAMPKGGDLHNHLTGAVYAEKLLEWAKHDGLCIDKTQNAAVFKSDCGKPTSVPIPSPGDPLYDTLLTAWSMKDFDAKGAESGHDHFFDAFIKFGLATIGHNGDMLADVAQRAAAEQVSYLELMAGLSANDAAKAADKAWKGKPAPTTADLEALHAALVASPDWPNVLAAGKKSIDDAETKKANLLACDGAAADPGCGVTVRWQLQATRSKAPHQVFAMMAAAFELAAADPRMVGLNLVAAEDNEVALRDYDLHMVMLDTLRAKYPKSPLHIALHAGELTNGVVPAEQARHLTFHIQRALDVGHAERIGHGIDVLGEDNGDALVKTLAKKKVLVEICLSSNALILGVEGAAHPYATYVAGGVPVALGSDDEGIARSSMTGEFTRAVTVQGLRYGDLKAMARASVAFSFLAPDAKKKLATALEKDLAAFEKQVLQ